MLLLRFGADPFEVTSSIVDKQVRELAKAKREEARKKGNGAKSTHKVPMGESIEAMVEKTGYKWSQLRSRYSLSKRGFDQT
jgi:hypothetical protein